MKETANKRILFGVLILSIIVLMCSIILREKEIRENIFGIFEQGVTEEVKGESISPLKEEKQYIQTGIEENTVYVPYYWKSGINTETSDYLDGYVPSLKSFQTYFETRESLLFGGDSDRVSIDVSAVFNIPDRFVVSGIQNTSEYFKWDEDTCRRDGDLFVCPNWVNWLGIPYSEKFFVMTDCMIDGIKGFCVFEDYVMEYFELQQTTETRCYASSSKSLCDVNEYLNVLQ